MLASPETRPVAQASCDGDTRVRTALRTNVALLGASVGVSLVFLEVAARFVMPAPLPWRFPQIRYREDPALIFVLEPNQRAFTADKPVTINARGLRGTLASYEHPPGRVRLLFLGDSIAFGFGVAEEEVVSTRVQSLLAKKAIAADVINSAVPAYNLDQEMTFLEREGYRYHADWVIVGVCWNDIHDKSSVGVDAWGRLVEKTSPPPGKLASMLESAPAYAIRNAIKSSRLAYAAMAGTRAIRSVASPEPDSRTRSDVLGGRPDADVDAGWKRIRGAMHRLRVAADTYGFRPLIVTFPIPLAIERTYPKSSYPGRVADAAGQEGFAFLDLERAFRAAYHGHESLFIPYDGDHPNSEGHAVAAREIANFLAVGN